MRHQSANQTKTAEAYREKSAKISTRQPSIAGAPIHAFLQLQRTIGNRAVRRLIKSGGIQAKLKISQPGDFHEQEADRVADTVMRMPAPRAQLNSEARNPESIQRKSLSGEAVDSSKIQRKCAACARGGGGCAGCKEEDSIQRKPLASSIAPLIQRQSDLSDAEDEEILQGKNVHGQPSTVTSDESARVQAPRGWGQPLPASERTFLEPRFGYDFSRVRVHTDARAADSARAVNARAYTIGRDIVFGAGEYAPETSQGRRLLAHELTHVVQQTSGSSLAQPTIQRQPADAMLAESSAEPNAEEPADPALIVDDEIANVGPDQMKKSEFLSQLQAEVCLTAEQAMAGTGRTTEDCPYLDFWFDYYSQKDGQHIERAIHRYVPESRRVGSASDYIPAITQRVRRGVETWVQTGRITEVPEGMQAELSGSTSAQDRGNTSAQTGRVQFKGRAGGPREASNPIAIHSQLGTGQPMESGVRSRMESAFGIGFSNVRVHADARAAGLSSRFNARAFTVGEHIALGSGEYQPGTLIGDALIAHELAHVVQQGGGSASNVPMQQVTTEYDALEEDADTSAIGAVTSLWGATQGLLKQFGQSSLPSLKSGLRLQRCSNDKKPEESFKAMSEVEQEALQRMKEDIDVAEVLLKDPSILEKEKTKIRKKINDTRSTLSNYEDIREQGQNRAMVMTPIVVASTAIVADDATVVGVADDPLLIPLGIAAIASLILTKPPPGKEAIEEAWRDVGRDMAGLAEVIDTVLMTAAGNVVHDYIVDEARELAVTLGLAATAGAVTREMLCKMLKQMADQNRQSDTGKWKKIIATMKGLGCRSSRASR